MDISNLPQTLLQVGYHSKHITTVTLICSMSQWHAQNDHIDNDHNVLCKWLSCQWHYVSMPNSISTSSFQWGLFAQWSVIQAVQSVTSSHCYLSVTYAILYWETHILKIAFVIWPRLSIVATLWHTVAQRHSGATLSRDVTLPDLVIDMLSLSCDSVTCWSWSWYSHNDCFYGTDTMTT